MSFKDGAGKKGNYEITTAAIGILNVKAVSSGGGSGSTAAPTISTEVVNGKIVVNGKTESTATENKVVIDKAQLGTVIEAAKAGNTLEIEVADNKAQATVQLPIENIEKMAEKEMVFAVKSGNVSYAIPAAAIDIKSLSKDLGAVNLADISLNVTIIKLDEAAQKQANEAVNAYGAEIVGVPIEFKMEAAYGDKTIELKIFGKYVQRIFEVTAEQVKNVTTAVVIEKDGSLRPVPTSIVNENGKWGIKISSKTNSTYALISNEKSFKDAEGKWYEDAVTEMASRCIVDGKTETSFAGDSKITRAEFATILVRALGLDGSNSAQFTDVKATSWYADAVGTAVEYGLVKGYADGSFAPNANITRQEAMIMIQCGAAIADYSGNTGTVTGFSDSAKIAKWAKEAVAFNVGSGLIKGSNGELNLSENISRAETAAVVLRLLQKAEIIDTRAVV